MLANFGLVRSFSLSVSSEMFTAGLPSLWKPCTCWSNVLAVGARAALGKLRKGVLFSGNTKQETTGISIAFNSPARIRFQKFWQTRAGLHSFFSRRRVEKPRMRAAKASAN